MIFKYLQQMRKLFFTALTLSLCASAAQAQKLYVRGMLGFAVANAGQTTDDTRSPHSGSMLYTAPSTGATPVLTSFKLKSVSFNTGIQTSLALGYMFNNNVGVELGADIGIAHIEHEGQITAPSSNSSAYTVTQFYSQYVKNPIILTPALCLQSGGKKINIYTRAGLAVPVRSNITTEIGQITTATGTNSSRSINLGYTTTTAFSLGFSGAAGVKYAVNSKLQLGAEISAVSLSLYLDKLEFTSYSENGVDLFSRLPEESKRISYGKSGGSGVEPTYSVPFSNVGLKVGVFYTLK
ncbi:MAG: hypothetical protein EOP56_18725 [Sphingobacteriales bacterium]|nr:MAG: hypothetical protein EOP56_18725 [Sphingobacteriales bacterium]